MSTKERREKVARENDWKEKMILILMMRTRRKMNAPISRFNKRLSRGRGGFSGYIFVKRGKGPILQKVISLSIIHSHKSIFFKFLCYFRASSMLSSLFYSQCIKSSYEVRLLSILIICKTWAEKEIKRMRSLKLSNCAVPFPKSFAVSSSFEI